MYRLFAWVLPARVLSKILDKSRVFGVALAPADTGGFLKLEVIPPLHPASLPILRYVEIWTFDYVVVGVRSSYSVILEYYQVLLPHQI